MKKILMAIILISAVALAVIFVIKDGADKISDQGFPRQSNEESGITITVEPKEVSPQSENWEFEVTLDTHSGDLDQDLKEVALLNNLYKPIDWIGNPPGGHHRTGILLFKAVKPLPKTLELKIEDRKFLWTTTP